MKNKIFFLFFLFCCLNGNAQNESLLTAVKSYFNNFQVEGYKPFHAFTVDSIQIDQENQELYVYPNESFCSQFFTQDKVDAVYQGLKEALPETYADYDLSILNKKSILIDDLVPNLVRKERIDADRIWRKTEYKGKPWVKKISMPYEVTQGLQNRHLFIWASHGRYYKEGIWQWQRPHLFCTTEDLFTQSFVYPYLFPMLEKAGAIVGTPRERDYQTHEAIVDNDHPDQQGYYSETAQDDFQWKSSADTCGFATPQGIMHDSIFPFKSGSYRYVPTTDRKINLSTITWMPQIPKAGEYAVYVSYASCPNSVPDATYTVFHKGGHTTFQVNQQMGGSTWVYLGTFEFDPNLSMKSRVVLSNHSKYKGIVTADGVRFGGGMGRVTRDSAGTSQLPAYLECARYYAQWAGIPDTLVNTERSTNDYADDLRVRGNMLNYLAGGSPYVPQINGQRVPFELALALHSDAGFRRDNSIYGTLSICTTQDKEGNTTYPSGLSRMASSDFSALLIRSLSRDISRSFNLPWIEREHWDRNYAETRMPDVPSAIFEMLSHQNYTDMKYGHDPFFKFTLARSVYKTILRYVNHQHGKKHYAVQPLPVKSFAAELSEDGSYVRLSWKPTSDALEPSAQPSGYVVYTKVEHGAFDNGCAVGKVHEYKMPIDPNKQYSFKVTAVNEGGESFDSETLSAYYAQGSRKKVLIVNGFTRLSGPAHIETDLELGFDLDTDIGVPYKRTTAFSGRQENFDVKALGLSDSSSLGFSGSEWEGREIAGNTFDYPVSHGAAIAASGKYSFSSISREAFEHKDISTKEYSVIDYIAGLEGDFKQNLKSFKTFSAATQAQLKRYLNKGGALLVSGSYIGSDNQKNLQDKKFLEEVLKVKYNGSARTDETEKVNGLNLQIPIYRKPNAAHYAAQAPDALLPANGHAFSAFVYGGGQGAGVAYPGKDYRVITMGFPFECICDSKIRQSSMQALLDFLTD